MPTPNRYLKRERQLRGWSQAHLAQQIDVPDYYISRWERGDVFPSPYYQQKLCELFGKTAEELGMLQAKNARDTQEKQEPITNPVLPTNPSSVSFDTFPLITHESPTTSIPPAASRTEQPPAEQWPFPLDSSPSLELPITASHMPAFRPQPKKRRARLWTLLIVLMAFLIVLVSGGLSIFVAHSRSNPALPSASIGSLSFLSSEQVTDASNQGSADEVNLQLQLLRSPSPGKSYYAWLLPDEGRPEDAVFLLGALKLHGSSGQLFYNDPEHTNLLAVTSRLLVTEESTQIIPLSPSIDPRTWRYSARLPNQVAPGQTYSFLDHLRHLLAADPKLHAHHILGGLAPRLARNVQAAYAQALDAKETWQATYMIGRASMKRNEIALLYYLEGASFLLQDLPTAPSAFSLSLDPKAVSIGLLQMDEQQEPPGYLKHITQHLIGLSSSPGATDSSREQIIHIMTAINTVNAWLRQVLQDARRLVMTPDQVLQPLQVTTLLNDQAILMNNVLVGLQDSKGNVQEGVEWISQAIEHLATIEITAYHLG
jgi:transcriptional regulator with XRE-family HTH domain